MNFVTLTFMLLFVHLIADYPLQGDFLAKAKNRKAPIPGVPWRLAMVSHAGIHAGFVWLVTVSFAHALFPRVSPLMILQICFAFAFIEFVLHYVIDDLKCCGMISFTGDQSAHVACKMLYAFILTVLPITIR